MSESAINTFEENAKKYAKIVATCWSDPAFLETFKKNPLQVLKEHGIEVPAGKTITVVEDTEASLHLVIPPRPAGLEKLSESDLELAAGGRCACAGVGGFGAPGGVGGCTTVARPGGIGGPVGPVGGAVIVGGATDDDW